MSNSYQSSGDHLRAPQGALQRPQNDLGSNLTLERYNENNIGDAKPQPMVPFASSSNHNGSLLVPPARQVTLQRPQNYFSPNNFMLGKHNENNVGDVISQSMVLLASSSNNNRPLVATGQGAFQKPQNHLNPNNFMPSRYHENNIGDSRSQSVVPMVPLASSSNINGSLAATRHGGTLPLSLTRNPPSPVGTLNMSGRASHVNLPENSSSNNVGLQGSSSTINIGFPNSAETIIHDQLKLPSMNDPETSSLHPSHHLTDSSLFKDFNAHPRFDINNLYHNVKDDVNIGRPPPTHNNQTPEPSNPNGNFKCVSLERALKRPFYELEFGIDDIIIDSLSKKPMIFIPTTFFGGGNNKPLKELDLFKDQKSDEPSLASSTETIEAQEEKKEENLDLSLHL